MEAGQDLVADSRTRPRAGTRDAPRVLWRVLPVLYRRGHLAMAWSHSCTGELDFWGRGSEEHLAEGTGEQRGWCHDIANDPRQLTDRLSRKPRACGPCGSAWALAMSFCSKAAQPRGCHPELFGLFLGDPETRWGGTFTTFT